MKMDLFLTELPQSVTVDGAEYPIDADFRCMLRIEALLNEEGDEAEKATEALLLFYKGKIPVNIEEAVTQMALFLQGEEESTAEQKARAEGDTARRMHPALYSFHYDSGLIYAAFLTQYGLDLTEIPFLHWWKFLALFEGMEDDRRIREVMRCRGVEIRADMPQNQKDYYNAMKKAYALPLPEGLQKHLSDLEAVLMGDGNVGGMAEWKEK